MIRHFPLYERTQLEFRAEYFDVLNHANLGDPQTNQTNTAAFGSILAVTSTGEAFRIGQMSLKLLF